MLDVVAEQVADYGKPEAPTPYCLMQCRSSFGDRIEYAFRNEPQPGFSIFVDGARPIGRITPLQRRRFIKATLETARRTGFRCCVVFEEEAVFCETDGQTVHSHPTPLHGILLWFQNEEKYQ